MPLKWQGYLVIFVVAASALIANFISLHDPIIDNYELAERLFALNGYIAISFATIMTPLLKPESGSIGEQSDRSLRKLHYLLASLGLALATAHPISVALRDLSFQVFIPRIDSWSFFWMNAGTPALYILYIAFIAALVRRKITRYWRQFHALMYIVLFLVIVHANLLGTDFQNPVVSALFDVLFAASILAFPVNRMQGYLKKRNAAVGDPKKS
jgi:DMSO/TMAO reductase YedYZ heme-binding membrane subunit